MRIYAGTILKGETPDFASATTNDFRRAIHLKTAKALGLTLLQILLARADEVIE